MLGLLSHLLNILLNAQNLKKWVLLRASFDQDNL